MATNTTEFGRLTLAMRDMLIDHIDGPLPVVREGDSRRPGVIKALMRRGLLSYSRPGAVGVNINDARILRPQATWLTDDGRAALAALLADYADALARAEAIRALMPAVESAPEAHPEAPAAGAFLPQTSNA